MNIYGIVYKIINITNNKVYVGQTVRNVEIRWKQHLYLYEKLDYPLYLAMRKYGVENFSVETICECYNQNELDNKEVYYTNLLEASVDSNGYVCRIGNGKGNLSAETKQRISEAMTNRYESGSPGPFSGKCHTEEAKRKMSRSIKETYAGIEHPNKGKTASQETRDKMSRSKKGRIVSQEQIDRQSKTWEIVSPEGNVMTITNLKKFCRENGLHSGGMYDVVNGKRRSYKGWRRKSIE
jgi:group I intron endonuclease